MADLAIARVFVEVLASVLHPQGHCVSLYGSVLLHGIGRDIDLVISRQSADACSEERVRSILESLGFRILLDERSSVSNGLVGLLRGYILDITLVG